MHKIVHTLSKVDQDQAYTYEILTVGKTIAIYINKKYLNTSQMDMTAKLCVILMAIVVFLKHVLIITETCN